jgi:hypothetical protein
MAGERRSPDRFGGGHRVDPWTGVNVPLAAILPACDGDVVSQDVRPLLFDQTPSGSLFEGDLERVR